MLQALQSLPPSQAEEVLARALDAFLPNLHEVVLGELEHRVIKEARDAVGADDAAVAERLGDELAKLMLPPEAEHAARQRLGHLGELPLSQYDIVFSEGWQGTERDGDGDFYGISRDEATRAFRKATAEFISRDRKFDPAAPDRAQSAGVLKAAAEDASLPHYISLTAGFKGSVATIESAWRVFLDQAQGAAALSPKRLLQLFVDRHGVEFRVNDEKPRRWYWGHSVPVFKVSFQFGRPSHGSVVVQVTDKEPAFICVGFLIDVFGYHQAMARHGIQFVSPSDRQSSFRVT